MMHEDTHAHLGFIHAVAQSLEVGVVIVEAGVDPLDGAEDAALPGLLGITAARAGSIAVEIVEQTAAVAVVKSRTGKVLRVLHIRGAAKANLALRIELVAQQV